MRHRLTDAAVKTAKPAEKPYRLTDGEGLYLFVNAAGHRRTVEQRLALNLLPWIGARPVVDLDPLEVKQCLARVVDRGALETAHRCATIVCQVYATKAVRRLVADRRMDELHDALPKLPPKRKRPHLAAVTEPRRSHDCFTVVLLTPGAEHVMASTKAEPTR